MGKIKRKICHFGRCAYPSTYGFKSEDGNIQNQQYCHKHAREIKYEIKAFPKCKMVKLFNFSLEIKEE